MRDITPAAVGIDGVIKTQTKGYCEGCTFKCTAAIDGKCAKTEDTLRQLRKGQQIAGAGI